jgi:hypothetical protein
MLNISSVTKHVYVEHAHLKPLRDIKHSQLHIMPKDIQNIFKLSEIILIVSVECNADKSNCNLPVL